MNKRFAIFQVVFSLISLAAVVWWAPTRRPAVSEWRDGDRMARRQRGALHARDLPPRRALAPDPHLIDCDTDRAHSYGLTTVGYMGNNVMPARAGEFLRVMLLDKQHGHGKRTLLGTVLGERILDALALGGIFLVVVVGVLHGAALPSGSHKPFIIAGIALPSR